MVHIIEKKSSQEKLVEDTIIYGNLRAALTKKGVFERDYRYYTFITIFTFTGLFFSGYQIFITPISLQLAFWCLLLAFFTVQIGGLIHDAGHRAIAISPKMNDFFGHIYASVIAFGYSFWKPYHDKHHAHPNEENEDPDLDLPLHGFTKRQFAQQKGLWKVLRKYQVYIFLPLRTLIAYTYRLDNLRYLKKEKEMSVLWWKVMVWIAGMFVWFFLPFFIFSLSKALMVFLVVHTATGFYISIIFAPNHKGMPQVAKGTKISFLEQQIVTSRNVSGNWLVDFVCMGLNYQIEHHLFPNTPRSKLKLIIPYVKDICQKRHLVYTETGFIESNRIILSELQKVARQQQ